MARNQQAVASGPQRVAQLVKMIISSFSLGWTKPENELSALINYEPEHVARYKTVFPVHHIYIFLCH